MGKMSKKSKKGSKLKSSAVSNRKPSREKRFNDTVRGEVANWQRLRRH
jgi:hypothetical protein